MSGNLNKYTSKNPLKQKLLHLFLNKITDFIGITKTTSLLDVGCGEGLVLKKILTDCPIADQANIIGLDVSAQALKIAASNNPTLKFMAGSIYDIKQKTGSFNKVICLEVLEHLDKPQAALNELLRVTKKTLILSVPNEPLFSLLRMLTFHDVLKFGKHIEHINYWNKYSFLKFITTSAKNCHIKVEQRNPWLIATVTKQD